MLSERRSKYLLWFSIFMVVFYVVTGLILSLTSIYKFENQTLIGVALIIYGIFRAARIWSAVRDNAYQE
ncbi:MAG: hypothetical protein K1X82_05270 [Bacteroidia bacterium]|nr:hypothetical protein [Bacteroidia bacterium]